MDDASPGTGLTTPAGSAGAVTAAPPATRAIPGRRRAARLAPRRRAARQAPRRQAARQAPWRLRLAIAGLAAAAVALAGTTGWLAVILAGSSAAGQQRTAVLTAARQEAIDLTTLDRSTGSRDYTAVLAGAGGALRQQLAQGRGAFLQSLSSARVSSVGTVLDAGIVTLNSRTATVLLNVRATVRNKRTYAPETRLYHWRAGLVRSGSRWLLTSLEFV